MIEVLRRPVESAQYTSAVFQHWCGTNEVTQSMGAVGVCWDNAMTESFFSHMKTEMCYQQQFANHLRARTAVMEYIQSWYNRTRTHAYNGGRQRVALPAHHEHPPQPLTRLRGGQSSQGRAGAGGAAPAASSEMAARKSPPPRGRSPSTSGDRAHTMTRKQHGAQWTLTTTRPAKFRCPLNAAGVRTGRASSNGTIQHSIKLPLVGAAENCSLKLKEPAESRHRG